MNPTTLQRPRTSLLTHAETETLAQLARGATLALAARRLGTSTRTVRRRVRRVCDRLGVDTTTEAIVWAVKNNHI